MPLASHNAFEDGFSASHVFFVRRKSYGASLFLFTIEFIEHLGRENSSFVLFFKIREEPNRWKLCILGNAVMVNVDHRHGRLVELFPICLGADGQGEQDRERNNLDHDS